MVLLSFVVPARPAQREIENLLRPEYEKKVLILRHFYADSKLRFDKDGKLLGDARRGYSTSDSMVYIDNLSIDKHGALSLKGRRILNIFDDKTGRFSNIGTKEGIQISVELDSTWQDASQVRVLLDRVFATDIRQTTEEIPKFLQCWQYGNAERKEDGRWHCPSRKKDVPIARIADSEPKYTMTDGRRVFYVLGGGVTAPIKVLSPAPRYADLAKKMGIQGATLLDVIINERGEASVIDILRPLGGGLDDKAIETLETWQFKPATYNGEPVAVHVNIETKFALY